MIIQILEMLYSLIFPKISLGDTFIGNIFQILSRYKFDYICWLSYTIFFILLIYIIINKYKNFYVKLFLTILCILFIFAPVYSILTLLNLYLELFIDNPPFIHNYKNEFPQSINIETKYEEILKEYNNYETNYNEDIKCIRESNPGFKIENRLNVNNPNCWRSIYIKKVGIIQEDIIKYFPITSELMKDDQIHNAFFSILDPEVEIYPHVGYYKGYLRYHLGVKIPENNGLKPYIVCGDEKYEWLNGKGIVFDDMYLHYVKNPTNKRRVVLYLDIKRRELSTFNQKVVDLGYMYIDNNPLIQLFVKNQHQQNKMNE